MAEPIPQNAASSSASSAANEAAGAGRFSLNRLSAAFARLTGSAPDESTLPTIPESRAELQPSSAKPTDDRQNLSPRMIIEGMLFVGYADGHPLTNRAMASFIRDVSPQEVDQIIADLNATYDEAGSSYRIVSEGAGYRLRLRPEFEPLRLRISGQARQVRLSPQSVEVLSIVAYQQPVTAEQITRSRGARSDGLLGQLVRRGLLRLERPSQTPQVPNYYTTERFNRLLKIRSISELPHSEDLDDN